MKYRLNYPWLDYEKGHVFETDDSGGFWTSGLDTRVWVGEITINLLVLSGALTPIKDEKVELPEDINLNVLNDNTDQINYTINAIIRYLKSKE